ncbi:hypothetical protein [Rhodoferax sp. GW822-FHT02A01]|uniref:hypothetical protein n=1 Tax=Rhodoferax sp. GW822-FHT02A01 TaxID=3141537 RepID=UPI00315C83BE
MKRLITIACLGAALCAPAFAQSDKGSQASALGLGGAFVVVGVVEGASEVVSLTLKGVEAGSTFVVKASTKAVKAASVATGTSIRVVAESTGYALMASGQLLAFVPNAIGQALLHQSQIK